MDEQTGDMTGQGSAGMQGGAPPPPPPLPVPAQVTVLGIIHLVLAVFGVVMAAFSGVMQGFSREMLGAQAGASGIAGAQARMQVEILEMSRTTNFINLAGMVLLALLLAVAGTLLLKRRAAGIKVSNAYAWLSILFKLASVVMFFAWTMPKLDPAMAEMAKSGGREVEMIGTVMRISAMAGAVLTPVIMCVYPILTLVLLNRPKVKKSLAAAR